MNTARVFWTGRSQAVRLPKEFRLEADEVRISKRGKALILEPIANDWAWLDGVAGPVNRDFVEAASEEPKEQNRDGLELFR